jgi:hypothetical protein
MRRASVAIATTAALWAAFSPAAFADAAGGLKQIGCVQFAGPPALTQGCTAGRALGAPSNLRISTDGRNAYATSFDRGVTVYDRGAGGALRQKDGAKGCIVPTGDARSDVAGCAQDGRITAGIGLALSADAQNHYVYVTATEIDAILTFVRADDGSLSLLQCLSSSASAPADCVKTGRQLNGPFAIDVNPTDGTVYVLGSNSLTAFTPSGAGTLTQRGGGAGCVVTVVAPAGCAQVAAITGDSGLMTTAGQVYVTATAAGAGTIVVLDPATLVQRKCLSSGAGCGTPYAPLPGVHGLALSPDGSTLYATASGRNAVVSLRRSADGSLTPLPAGCVAMSTDAVCPRQGLALGEIYDVVAAADGAQAYVTSRQGDSVTTFDVSPDGTLTQRPPAFGGCVSISIAGGCTAVAGVNWASDVTMSADDRNVYVNAHFNPKEANSNAVTSFVRDRAPACAPVTAATDSNTSVTVQLSCSDPDGDALAYEIVSAPARGIVGAVQPNGTVTYGPIPGSSGADTFAYRAVAYGVPTAPATVTVDVTRAALPIPPGPGPTPLPQPVQPVQPTPPPVTVAHNWLVFPSSRTTRVTQLTVKGVPIGATVQITCKGKKCPFKRKRITAKSAVVKLVAVFKKRRMPAGTRLEIRVTKAGTIGKVVTFTLQ